MCRQLERQLSLKGLEYTQVEGAEAIKELGFTVAPILEVDGQYMNFREAIGWVRSQKEPA